MASLVLAIGALTMAFARTASAHNHDFGSSDDLVAGTVVDDAILVLADGKATFAKIDLAGSDDNSSPTARSSKAKK